MTRDLSRVELSLLLFLETCAVDQSGRVDVRHMNEDDKKIAERWNAEGYVRFGRIASRDIISSKTHWCYLSVDAWKDAAEGRKAKADRTWLKRIYKTTEEARAAG